MKFKVNFLRTIFLIILWMVLDWNYISISVQITDVFTLSNAIMSPYIGYNNLMYIPGFLLTGIFILFSSYNFKIDKIHILKLGRNKTVNICAKNVLLDTFLFSLEFVLTNTIYCIIFVDLNLLYNYKFGIFSVLYLVMICCYFLIVAFFTLLVKISLNNNKMYVVVALICFFTLNGLAYFGITVSPLYFSFFMETWFLYHKFNTLQYFYNLLICIVSSSMLFYISRLLFLKKDVLVDE